MWTPPNPADVLPQMMRAESVPDLSVPLVVVATHDHVRLVGACYAVAQTHTF